jgi:lipid-A-disaccharide synthase
MKKLFFSVGEPSGDLHAANLIRSLQSTAVSQLGLEAPSLRGFGGPQMRAAGCALDFELTNLAVVGFAEVLPKLREFFRVADIASDVFRRDRPDGVVLIDFPGFNWHIAKRAQQAGIPVFYYLPPQLWAWGAWRLRKMRRYVDHVLCNLPFEPAWYAKRGVEVDYVGHPFFDEVAKRQLDGKFIAQWSSWDGTQVVVLPGSRSREVKSIWPMQLAAIRELARRHPTTRFLVACYQDRHCLSCQRELTAADADLNLKFFFGRTSELIELADCALMKSGSVSLEMMARGTPAVVVYHASRSLYAIGKCLVNLDSMTLPNMMAGRKIMPEFLAVGGTGKATAQAIEAMEPLIADSKARQSQRDELRQLSQQYAKPGASERAAAVILNKLGVEMNVSVEHAA